MSGIRIIPWKVVPNDTFLEKRKFGALPTQSSLQTGQL